LIVYFKKQNNKFTRLGDLFSAVKKNCFKDKSKLLETCKKYLNFKNIDLYQTCVAILFLPHFTALRSLNKSRSTYLRALCFVKKQPQIQKSSKFVYISFKLFNAVPINLPFPF